MVKMYAPYLTKFNRVDFSTGILREGVDYPLIWYSDMLLTYAEATNEVGGQPPMPTKPSIKCVDGPERWVPPMRSQPRCILI